MAYDELCPYAENVRLHTSESELEGIEQGSGILVVVVRIGRQEARDVARIPECRPGERTDQCHEKQKDHGPIYASHQHTAVSPVRHPPANA